MRGVKIAIADAAYPETLRNLPNPPLVLTTSGSLTPRRAVAIVGSRDACDEALIFAYGLAYELAKAGIVVVSGGAIGVDGAAHRGALAAGGATWVVCPTGKNRVYPPQHRTLFAEVAASKLGRMLWPFDDDVGQTNERLIYRNGILAALSETLVVVQARYQSGSRNAAKWARSLGRPIWAVTAAPWMESFCGSLTEIEEEKARPLCSARQLFKALGLDAPAVAPLPDVSTLRSPKGARRIAAAELRTAKSSDPSDGATDGPKKDPWSAEETLVFSHLSPRPTHIDQILDRVALSLPVAVTALLTLSMKDVVVEGPDGFFRRRSVA